MLSQVPRENANRGRASRPVVVQHSFGAVGTGGPIGALQRLMDSSAAEEFDFHEMKQPGPLGGVDLSLIRRWQGQLRELAPDMVHVRGLGNEGFHGAFAARAAGVPRVLVSVHGTHRDLTMPPVPAAFRALVVRRGLEPATLAMATHVTTVCEYAARRPFIARWSSKVAGVVPNGVDLQPPRPATRERMRADLGIGPSHIVVMSVGRLSHEKGLGDLAGALHLLSVRDPEALRQMRVVLVGDGPDRSAIEDAFHGIPKSEPLFLGRRLDVAELLAAADIFVLPSWHENLSNALLEAMAAALPVIATNVGGNTEVIERGSGILVPPRSPAELSRALAALTRDRSARVKVGESARTRVAERYSTERMVQGWSEMYRRILEGPA